MSGNLSMTSDYGGPVGDGFGNNLIPADDEAQHEAFFGMQVPGHASDIEMPDLDLDPARPCTRSGTPTVYAALPNKATNPPEQNASEESYEEQGQGFKSPGVSDGVSGRRSAKMSLKTTPVGAVIIDVDAVDAPEELPVTIKTEGPDIIMLNEHISIHIKQEPGDGKFDYWNFSEASIDLSSDGEYEASPVHIQRLRSQSPHISPPTHEQPGADTFQQDLPVFHESSGTITGPDAGRNSPPRKFCYKQPTAEDSTDVEDQSPEQAVAPDAETIHEENIPQPENFGQPETPGAPVVPTTLKAGTSMLKTPNPKAKHTSARIAKMFEIQKILAERARKGPKFGGAGAVFNSNPASASGDQPRSGQNAGPAAQVAEDPHAWMHDQDDLDDEEDPNA